MISANVNATGPNGTLIVGLPVKRDPLTLPSHRQNENCWPETRGLYIRVLAPTVDTHFTRVILDIMESIGTRADWDAMMAEAGPLRTIRIALDDLSALRQYAPRIVALERRWGMHLREEPPR